MSGHLNRRKCLVVADSVMEVRARRANAVKPGKSKSMLKVVEDAAELALRYQGLKRSFLEFLPVAKRPALLRNLSVRDHRDQKGRDKLF